MFNTGKPRIDPNRVVLTPNQVRAMEETRVFYERLQRRPYATYALLAVIVCFWGLSMICGAQSDPKTLIRMGAKINLFIDLGQSWRFVSPIFLHFGILHILFNGYALYLLGRMIENLYGIQRFLLIFFFAGVASIVASYLGSDMMSVGASGAIFGLLGAGTVVGYRFRSDIPPIFRRFFGRGLLPWIVLNLALGFVIEGIDNYAHIGGLIVGSLVAFPMRPIFVPRNGKIGMQPIVTLAALCATVVMLAVIGIMLHNMFIDDSLPAPKQWASFQDPASMVSARIPKDLVATPNSEIRFGRQYVEPNLGFWVAVEREPDRQAELDRVVEDLVEEVNRTSEINANSLKFEAEEETQIDGRPAQRVRFSFSLKEQTMRYDVEVWVIPTGMGSISATCSAPDIFYDLFRNWCDGFIDSIRIMEAG